MSRLLKKLLISFLVGLQLLFVFSSPVKAAWYNPDYKEFLDKVKTSNDNDIFGERYTYAQVWWVVYSLISFLTESAVGSELTACISRPDSVETCLEQLSQSPTRNSYAVKPVEKTNLLVKIFTEDRPISAISYFRKSISRFGLVPEVQAQGTGFRALEPIQDLWKSARNITYSLFVLAIIILSFMIMFRVKISPQVVITVQSALPRVVIALILVTFSYAIAGLLVDLMYVVIGILSLLLNPSSPTGTFETLTTGILGTGIIGLFLAYLGLFTITISLVVLSANGIFSIPSLLLGANAGLGIVVFIVLLVILIFVGLKTGWLLLKTFANILLGVVAAPIYILIGVLVPGLGFGTWLKGFISNLAIFPTVGVLFFLAMKFLFVAVSLSIDNSIIVRILQSESTMGVFNSFLGNVSGVAATGWPPLLPGNSEKMVMFLLVGVSFVLVTIIPKTAELIQSIIKGQPFAYGTAVGEAFGPLRIPAAGAVGYGTERLAGKAGVAGTWLEGLIRQTGAAAQKQVLGR